jgi:putative phosphoesterase
MSVTRIGVISDTHGLLRPEAIAALAGSDMILHAGDICDSEILTSLERIAPLHAVRGNNDIGAWARHIKVQIELDVDGCHIVMLHDVAQWKKGRRDAAVVITGHSHRPLIEQRNDTLMLNPGSAGPRRFSLPVSLALLVIENGHASARIIDLVPATAPAKAATR